MFRIRGASVAYCNRNHLTGEVDPPNMEQANGQETAPPNKTVVADGYKYWAFISYSHQDETWARWLHESLETYKVPRRLIGRPSFYGPVPERVFPVFRDREELPGSFDLGGTLQAALRQSRILIVICSPRSAVSRWVNEEIKEFKAWGREDRVLCLIVEGEPNATDKPELGLLECFPPALRFRVGADGKLTDEHTEPIAADARKDKDGRENAKLKVLAGILGVGFDELRQREVVRQRKRRLKIGTGVFGLMLALAFVYLAMADKGWSIPGGERVRTIIDRHNASVLRPVPQMEEIRRAAVPLRRQVFDSLTHARTPDGWIKASLKPNEKLYLETWSHSQALCGMFRMPEASNAELHALLPNLETPFKPNVPVEAGALKFGWISHQDDTDTVAEPALWTTAALAAALARPGLLNDTERRRLLAHLAYTQEVLKLYRPLDDGGWNMFPRQTEAGDANPYTTTLALLALLELKRANVPWEGSAERRDELLRKTAQWLLNHYDTTKDVPGWSGGTSADETFDGLTLEIYALLLRAQAEANVTIPPAMLAQMPKHIAACVTRDFSFPTSSGEFVATCLDQTDRAHAGKESVGFLWLPWAIDAAQGWLTWAEQHNAPPEERTRVRRALGHMVLQMGNDAVKRASTDWTFISAETLYGLSEIKPL
ncbi:MAG: hypothetical protein DMF64_04065 [Acidobacteria bacterium]|nr:MAG: hypothetical protein DMF64_04065 [Acidobacteriota bacterium]